MSDFNTDIIEEFRAMRGKWAVSSRKLRSSSSTTLRQVGYRARHACGSAADEGSGRTGGPNRYNQSTTRPTSIHRNPRPGNMAPVEFRHDGPRPLMRARLHGAVEPVYDVDRRGRPAVVSPAGPW